MASEIVDIPISARTSCLDGLCGSSTAVIINPATMTITYVVIKADTFPSGQYLVPLSIIMETTLDHIRLACTKEALQQLEPFIETEFVSDAGEEAETAPAWPQPVPARMKTPIEHERTPPGEMVVYRETLVEAIDGPVGELDAFLLDPGTAQITHLVLVEGKLGRKRDITLPVSAIERIAEDRIYLKLTKEALESLPMLPLKRFYHWQDEAVHTLELLVIAFDTFDRAGEAVRRLKQLRRDGMLDILNVATLVKDETGKVSLKEHEDVNAPRGALFGAITGGLIGLIAGPIGAVVGAVAGAAAGGAAAHWLDMGFSNDSLQALQQALQPGRSALVALVEQKWVDKVLAALAEFKGQRLQQTLTDEMARQLIARAEERQSRPLN